MKRLVCVSHLHGVFAAERSWVKAKAVSNLCVIGPLNGLHHAAHNGVDLVLEIVVNVNLKRLALADFVNVVATSAGEKGQGCNVSKVVAACTEGRDRACSSKHRILKETRYRASAGVEERTGRERKKKGKERKRKGMR